jgi:superfamily II DNA/RNA helicase
MRDPITVSVKKKDITSSVTQDVVFYEHHHKFDLLVTLLGKKEFERVIIFGAMKHSVEKLARGARESLASRLTRFTATKVMASASAHSRTSSLAA